jgi:rubrerythrin
MRKSEVGRMGYAERMRQAKERVKELAKEYYMLLKNKEIDWDEMKELLHYELSELKHYVYGEAQENEDRYNRRGDLGHDIRMDIFAKK